MTRVLVVDNHPMIRRGVRQVLAAERPDLTVEEAGDAPAALAGLEAGACHLLLLDINLPGLGGLALLEEARRRYPEVPVLVLSAYPELEFGVRALELGAAGYLPKASAADQLVVAVQLVLEGGTYVSAALAEWLASRARPGHAPAAALSERERQVLRLVAEGLTLREIGVRLGVSQHTVASYRSRLSSKLGLTSAVELTRYALRHGLLG